MIIVGDVMADNIIIPSFAPADDSQQGLWCVLADLLYRVFRAKLLAPSDFPPQTRYNIFLGITKIIGNLRKQLLINQF